MDFKAIERLSFPIDHVANFTGLYGRCQVSGPLYLLCVGVSSGLPVPAPIWWIRGASLWEQRWVIFPSFIFFLSCEPLNTFLPSPNSFSQLLPRRIIFSWESKVGKKPDSHYKIKQREQSPEQGRWPCGLKLYVALWSIMCGHLIRHEKEKERLKCIKLTQ